MAQFYVGKYSTTMAHIWVYIYIYIYIYIHYPESSNHLIHMSSQKKLLEHFGDVSAHAPIQVTHELYH